MCVSASSEKTLLKKRLIVDVCGFRTLVAMKRRCNINRFDKEINIVCVCALNKLGTGLEQNGPDHCELEARVSFDAGTPNFRLPPP